MTFPEYFTKKGISSAGVIIFDKLKDHIFEKELIEKKIIRTANFEKEIRYRIDLEEFPEISDKDIESICRILQDSEEIKLIIEQLYVFSSNMDKSLTEIEENFVSLFPENIKLRNGEINLDTQERISFLRKIFKTLDEGIQSALNRAVNEGSPGANNALANRRHFDEKDLLKDMQEKMIQKENKSSQMFDQLGELLPILNPQHSLKKLSSIIDILECEINNNPDFNIELVKIHGKNIIKLVPKNEDIDLDIKFELPFKKLNSKNDVQQLIYSKLREGEAVVFTEDEILEFYCKNPQLNDYGKPIKIEILPNMSAKDFYFNFWIEGTDLVYHEVEMASIYNTENEITLISLNLPFKIILCMKLDPFMQLESTSLNIKGPKDLKEVGILDLDKFFHFISLLNDGKTLLCKDSKRDIHLFSFKGALTTHLNKNITKLTEKMAKIDTTFHLNFMYPENVTLEDMETINNLISFIDNHFINFKMEPFEISLDQNQFKMFLKNYESNKSIKNLQTSQDVVLELFNKKINLGRGICEPQLTIMEDIQLLSMEKSYNDKIKITLVPVKNEEKIFFK